MIRNILQFAILTVVSSVPHLYNPYEPYFKYDRIPYYNPLRNYAHQIPTYTQFIPTFNNDLIQDKVASSYLATPDILPTLNVLAEVPYSISTKFTVVPMLLMSKENMNLVSNVHIMGVSKDKPLMTIKTEDDNLLQCTPAVRIVLDKPIIMYSLKTSVLFPSEVLIVYKGYKIPVSVGAVIAPIQKDIYVSTETPVSIKVVYAIPTKPIIIDYVNNEDAIFIPENEAVVIESDKTDLPPKNVTVLTFPDKEAEPSLQVDEEDEELVNRNPPLVLAPAGIIQSTQPIAVVEPFTNPKESSVLTALREEAKKRL